MSIAPPPPYAPDPFNPAVYYVDSTSANITSLSNATLNNCNFVGGTINNSIIKTLFLDISQSCTIKNSSGIDKFEFQNDGDFIADGSIFCGANFIFSTLTGSIFCPNGDNNGTSYTITNAELATLRGITVGPNITIQSQLDSKQSINAAASTVVVTNNNTLNATTFPVFVQTGAGNRSLGCDTGYNYNPQTGVLVTAVVNPTSSITCGGQIASNNNFVFNNLAGSITCPNGDNNSTSYNITNAEIATLRGINVGVNNTIQNQLNLKQNSADPAATVTVADNDTLIATTYPLFVQSGAGTRLIGCNSLFRYEPHTNKLVVDIFEGSSINLSSAVTTGTNFVFSSLTGAITCPNGDNNSTSYNITNAEIATLRGITVGVNNTIQNQLNLKQNSADPASTVTVANNDTLNASTFPVFVQIGAGTRSLGCDTGYNYTPSTGVLFSSIFSSPSYFVSDTITCTNGDNNGTTYNITNAEIATLRGITVGIGSTIQNQLNLKQNSADPASTVTVANNDTLNASTFPVFVQTGAGTRSLGCDTNYNYNPLSETLSSSNIKCQTVLSNNLNSNTDFKITSAKRINQQLSSNDYKTNGYYALAKNTYPGLNPYSSGDKAVSIWTTRTTNSNNWNAVCWSPKLGIFCAVATSGTNNRVMTSPDGIIWTTRSTNNNNWRWVCWSPEREVFCAVAISGGNDRAMISPDGINWTLSTTTTALQWFCVCWSAELNIFCAVANGGANPVMTSPDGLNWTQQTTLPYALIGVCWSPELNLFVAARNGGGTTYISSNGVNWEVINLPTNRNFVGVNWSPELNQFVQCSQTTGYIITSYNGRNWVEQTIPVTHPLYGIEWSKELGLWVVVGDGSPNQDGVITSPDGINWTTRLTNGADWRGICWSPELGIFVSTALNTTNEAVMTSSLLGRPTTSYNVFNNSYNNIDQFGKWTFNMKSLLCNNNNINLESTSITTSTANHTANIKTTSNNIETTNFLKLKLNGNDIWLPYFTSDPSI